MERAKELYDRAGAGRGRRAEIGMEIYRRKTSNACMSHLRVHALSALKRPRRADKDAGQHSSSVMTAVLGIACRVLYSQCK